MTSGRSSSVSTVRRARIAVTVQRRAAEVEVPQHAAEGALQIGLGEDLRGRPRGQHGAVDQHDLVAEVGHAAEIVRRDQHQVALRAQLAQQRR